MPAGWVAAAAAVGGAIISSQGSKSAAQTQANAANNAAAMTQQQWQTINSQEQPWMQSGYGAQNQLNYLLGIGNPQQYATQNSNYQQPTSGAPSGTYGGQPMGRFGQAGNGFQGVQAGPGATGMQVDASGNQIPNSGGASSGASSSTPYSSAAGGFGSLVSPFTIDTFHNMSPAYQFQLQQGQQGVLNADSGNAGALSGAAQKDLIGYNQNMANTAFNNAFNQYQTQQGNIYSRLAGISQLGQNAASNSGMQGANLAASTAQSITNAGSAQAAGQVGAANAYAGGINSAVPWLVSAYQNNNPSPGSSPGSYVTTDPGGSTPAGTFTSDRRLKKDITAIGKSDNGLTLYSFRYVWDHSEDTVRMGYMADEVEKVFPSAVTVDENGFKMVNYNEVPARA